MAPGLEDCSNEIIESVVLLLDLDDIRSLRLCSRSLAEYAAQNHFKSYYRSKRVDVREHILRAFTHVTESGRLGCLVQDLVLVGVVDATDVLSSTISDGARERGATCQPPQTNVKLLAEAFGNIAANNRTRKLLSLSLEVELERENAEERLTTSAAAKGSWHSIWRSAIEVFHAAFGALAASKLPIEKLNVFNQRQLQRCSLASDELSRVEFEDPGLVASLENLNSLSISLSGRIIDDIQSPTEKDINNAKAKAADKSNFIGLARLLQLCSQVKDFAIHYYQLRPARHLLQIADFHNERLLQAVAKSDQLPILTQCTLRGLYVREDDLLVYIKRTSVRHLFMENVIISSGNFRSVFDYCSSDAADMKELYFDDLFEKHNRLYFDGPGQVGQANPPLQPSTDHAQSTNSLHRAGFEVKRSITYHYHEGMVADTPQTRDLRQRRVKEYGPL